MKKGFVIRRFFAFALLVFAVGRLNAQPADSARLFSLKEYTDWVLRHHPVAARAALLDNQADAAELSARGAFDPKVYSDWEQKSFDGKEYFTVGESGFKVASWYGLEFKGSFMVADGIYQNPANEVPAAGQAQVGIKASLGQGLFIDERRAALQQAQLLERRNEAERREMLNDLMLDATKAYWDWAVTYNQLLIYQRAIGVAEQRFQGLVESFIQGDKPAIDTLETLILLQNWQFDLNQSLLEYRNAGLALSNFLWFEGQLPVEVTPALRPPSWAEDPLVVQPVLRDFLDLIAVRHPTLQQFQVDLQQLDVDRRLAAEMLKPRLDLEYNFLGNGFRFGQVNGEGVNGISDILLQNYKWGLTFEFPLFLRKERGKLEMTKIKMTDVDFKLQQKRLEISNKVRQYYNDLLNTRDQINLISNMVANYQALLDAELRKFEIGESSIFLINSREQKLFESQLKLVKLEGELRKANVGLNWSAGLLGQ